VVRVSIALELKEVLEEKILLKEKEEEITVILTEMKLREVIRTRT